VADLGELASQLVEGQVFPNPEAPFEFALMAHDVMMKGQFGPKRQLQLFALHQLQSWLSG